MTSMVLGGSTLESSTPSMNAPLDLINKVSLFLSGGMRKEKLFFYSS
jgi:hypothetical protein